MGAVLRCHLPKIAVWYPAACMRFGNVGCEPSNLARLSKTPFRWLYLPVRMTARLGAQIEFVTSARSNRIPSRAMRSMLGVWLIIEPYALMAW